MPGLLLLIGRDLLVHDRTRTLAWRLSHEPRLAVPPVWLAHLLPSPPAGLDRDPVALLLAAFAVGLATLYLALGLLGARPGVRAALVAVGCFLLVVIPTASLVAMGVATNRPYGQDGGVVQLPLALDKILDGESPYGADYSDSILGRQSRVSAFWARHGGNPILRHHAYLPGTHLIMMPFYLASRAWVGFFDPRFVTLMALALAAVLAVRLLRGPPQRLTAAAVVLLNPLVYWHQVFGANDLLFVALILGAVLSSQRGRPCTAGALLGAACATKQLAWPFAPFLLAQLSGAGDFRELLSLGALSRLKTPLLAFAGVLAVVLAPVALLDPSAFYGDIVVYNVGLPGADNYPLGGTPGFGFANFLIYFGAVSNLRDHFPFGIFFLLFVPLGLALLRVQLRERGATTCLLTGSVALLVSVYFSRVVHPNYVAAAAILLPLAVLAGRRTADTGLVPLLLLAAAVDVASREPFRAVWEQISAAGLLPSAAGSTAGLWPRAAEGLTADPMALGLGALSAGLGIAYLAASVLGLPVRMRTAAVAAAIVAAVAAPTALLVDLGQRAGTRRAQDAWAVEVPAAAGRLSRGESPYTPPPEEAPQAREAWSTSFRLEPPRLLTPERPPMPPGPAILGLLTGTRDPRFLALLALGLLVAVAGPLAPPGRRPLALGVAGLTPPLVMGIVVGHGSVLPAAFLASAFLAWGQPLAMGALTGLACAMDHRVLLVVLVLVFASSGSARTRLLAGCASAYGLLVLPVAALDPPAFVAALGPRPGFEAGVGLANGLLYLGWSGGGRSALLLSALAAGFAVFLGRLGAERGHPSLAMALSASGLLAALFLSPGGSPEALALPLVLLLLSAVVEPGLAAPGAPAPPPSQRAGRVPSPG